MKFLIVIIVIIYNIQNYIRIYIKKYTLDNTCVYCVHHENFKF